MPYITSTLSTDQNFPLYTKREGAKVQAKKIARNITIAGRANVASKNLITPAGVVTQVTAEELELLEKNPAFKRKVARGFLSVTKTNVDPDKKAADMTAKDKSAPITPTKEEQMNAGKAEQDKVKITTGAPGEDI